VIALPSPLSIISNPLVSFCRTLAICELLICAADLPVAVAAAAAAAAAAAITAAPLHE
jgi:hypothetical protein